MTVVKLLGTPIASWYRPFSYLKVAPDESISKALQLICDWISGSSTPGQCDHIAQAHAVLTDDYRAGLTHAKLMDTHGTMVCH